MELVRELAMDGSLYMLGLFHTLLNPSLLLIPYLLV